VRLCGSILPRRCLAFDRATGEQLDPARRVDVTTRANSEVRLRSDNEIADTYRLTSARVSFYFDAPSGTQVADYGLLQHQPIDVGNAFTDVTGLGVILQPDTDDNANAAEDDHDETSLRLQLYAEGIGANPDKRIELSRSEFIVPRTLTASPPPRPSLTRSGRSSPARRRSRRPAR